jgi:hypothetical protein
LRTRHRGFGSVVASARSFKARLVQVVDAPDEAVLLVASPADVLDRQIAGRAHAWRVAEVRTLNGRR